MILHFNHEDDNQTIDFFTHVFVIFVCFSTSFEFFIWFSHPSYSHKMGRGNHAIYRPLLLFITSTTLSWPCK